MTDQSRVETLAGAVIETLVAKITAALPEVQAIYLFGSQVTGGATKDSDLDIAVLVPTNLPALVMWNLGQDLAGALNIDVDLIDFRKTSTVMQLQILQADARVFVQPNSEVQVDTFETGVMSEYCYLRDRQADQLSDIARTGKIYE